jgi:hypothetical protein
MSKTPSRIYMVTNSDDVADRRLVRASTQAQALRYVFQPFEARIASQDDLVALLADSVEIEDGTK